MISISEYEEQLNQADIRMERAIDGVLEAITDDPRWFVTQWFGESDEYKSDDIFRDADLFEGDVKRWAETYYELGERKAREIMPDQHKLYSPAFNEWVQVKFAEEIF